MARDKAVAWMDKDQNQRPDDVLRVLQAEAAERRSVAKKKD